MELNCIPFYQLSITVNPIEQTHNSYGPTILRKLFWFLPKMKSLSPDLLTVTSSERNASSLVIDFVLPVESPLEIA